MTDQPIFTSRLSRLLHLAVWLFLTTVGFFILSNFMDDRRAFYHAFFNSVLLSALFYGNCFLVNIFLEKKKYGAFFGAGGLFFAAISTVRVLLNLSFTGTISSENQSIGTPEARVVSLVLTTSFFITAVAVSYQMLVNRFRNEQRHLALINRQQAAQLKYLKAQINPHFLFNALNNLHSLVVSKSENAPKMLLQISDLLRFSIYDGQRETVSLQRETERVRRLIDLFSMTKEQPPNIKFEVSGNLADHQIEPMTFLPLVENCLKHSDLDARRDGFIKISLAVEPTQILFSTANTFNKNDRQKDAVGGVGLENIRQRLLLRYGEKHEFFAMEKSPGIFETQMKIFFGK